MRLFFPLLLLLVWNIGVSQIVNYSARLIIDPGGNLLIEDDFHNINAGIVENSGTLEITGDFLNSGTYQRSAVSNVIFSGGGSSIWTSGGNVFNKASINKSSGFSVTLGDGLRLDSLLNFQAADNKLVLGEYELVLARSHQVIGSGSENYIQADGIGKVKKEFGSLGTLDFPIGDVDDYSPISIEVTSGSPGVSASFAVNVVDAVHPFLPIDAIDHISRYWNVDTNDIDGFEANLIGTYQPSDLEAAEFRVYGASYDGFVWNYLNGYADSLTNTVLLKPVNKGHLLVAIDMDFLIK